MGCAYSHAFAIKKDQEKGNGYAIMDSLYQNVKYTEATDPRVKFDFDEWIPQKDVLFIYRVIPSIYPDTKKGKRARGKSVDE